MSQSPALTLWDWCKVFLSPLPPHCPQLFPSCRELGCHAYVCSTSTTIWYWERGNGKGSFLTNVWLNICETNNLCMPCLFLSYKQTHMV